MKGIFSAGYNFVDDLTGGKLTEIKDNVAQKLGDIKATYEEHGGGIQGVAAVAMEGVKGVFSAGYNFVNDLTGGKLTEIKDKFVSGVSNIAAGVRQKITDVKVAFSNGITNIKDTVTGAVTWFFESGKRVVSTFANGISSAFTKAVDAVKGGLQKVRNLLPFSDAKEGPLSTLTLSGQRTMTTYAHGLTLAQDAPAEAVEQGLKRTDATLRREPAKKVRLTSSGEGWAKDDESGASGNTGGKTVIIQKLLMQVDLKTIKDLQQLIGLLQEIEDITNSNGSDYPSGDPDLAPEPA